jgi:hypothetical protein
MGSMIWLCVAVYALAMAGVSVAAHRIVENFGALGGLVTIVAMLATAAYLDQCCRSPEARVDR